MEQLIIPTKKPDKILKELEDIMLDQDIASNIEITNTNYNNHYVGIHYEYKKDISGSKKIDIKTYIFSKLMGKTN